MMASRKRRLPNTAAAAFTGSASKMVFRSSVMLLVFSESRWLPSKQLRSTDMPSLEISQIRPSLALAAEGASVIEADTTHSAVARRAPFVDDGMFDPRRDYWGIDGITAGGDAIAMTPASSDWDAGEIKEFALLNCCNEVNALYAGALVTGGKDWL